MTSRINALIVDDEKLARGYLRSLLADHQDIRIVGECADGAEAVRVITNDKPDLVFLDIQMAEMTGMEVIESVGVETMPVTVFTTAYDEYALRAFDMHAVDYLLKPFTKKRFREAVDKVRHKLSNNSGYDISRQLMQLLASYNEALKAAQNGDSSDSSDDQYLTRIPVKNARKVVLVNVEDIDWIEAADYTVILHCDGSKHMLTETMTNLESQLNPARFIRTHRGAIVNVERIKELRTEYGHDYEIILHNGASVKLSRRRKDKLEALLGRSF